MTSLPRRKNAIVLPISQAAELTALLATLDGFIRSSPRIAGRRGDTTTATNLPPRPNGSC